MTRAMPKEEREGKCDVLIAGFTSLAREPGGWLARSRSQPWKPILHEDASAMRGVQIAALASANFRENGRSSTKAILGP